VSGALREVLASFEIDVDAKALDEGLRRVESFKSTIKSAISDLKKAFSFEDFGLGGMIDGLASKSGELKKVTETYGIGLDDLQRLMFQTGKGAEELGGSFRILEKNISQAGGKGESAFDGLEEGMAGLPGGGKKAGEAFKALGIDLETLKDKSPTEVFTQVGEAIGGLQNPSDRTAAAMAIFGRQGASLIPVFLKDKDAIRALGEEYDKVGGFTEDNVARFAELGRTQKSQELGWQKLKLLLAEQFLPALIKIQSGIAWLVQGFAKVTQKSSGFKVAAAAIAVAIAVANAGMLKFILNTARAALPWIALFLLVEDFVTFLQGGKSVFGDVLDYLGEKLFGVKNAGQIVRDFFTDGFFSFDNATADVEQFWEDVQRLFKFGFGETWTGIVQWLEDLDTSIATWAGKAISFFIETGPKLVQGLIDGITGKTSAAVEAIENLGTEMWTALKNKLGIHSPSVVFRAVGENIDAGLAQGIEGGGRAPMAAEQLVRAPSISNSSTSYGPRTANVQNSNQIEINIRGGDRGIADQVRDGLAQAFNDDRRATLAALEEQAA
jgi:hypothetical protein